MDVLTRLVVMIGLLAVGVGLRTGDILTARRVGWLNSVAFYVVLPALVFDSTHDEPLGEIISVRLLVGVVALVAVTAVIAMVVHRRLDSPSARAAATVQSYHTNLGYIGLPVVASALGERAAAIGSVVLGIGALVQIPLTVMLLVRITGAGTNVRDELGRLVTNPVLIALLVGLAVSQAPFAVTGRPAAGIALVAEAALPIALLCVGGSIELESIDFDRSIVGRVLALKLLAMPAVAWLVLLAVGATPATLRTVVVMFGAPTAVSTFIYVTEMGGDRRLASVNVFLTTVASAITLSALIAFAP
ncbi:AEC family transporter [Halorhabdus sp. CUG00001]|uniref:AEC family transporter n=1 Tax=Halorhabdus sp. CUG00001 TaxID=2600297 RepID=UPI00131E41E5|nr:AEC family transporter [Halorhabdus sp. CUG00001]